MYSLKTSWGLKRQFLRGKKTSPAFVGALALFCTFAPCLGQGTFEPLLITFDGPPLQPPGTAYFVGQYFESGLWFRPLGPLGPGNGFVRNGGGNPPSPENGTAYVQATLGDSLVFSFTNGTPFDLTSVDLAEYSTVVPDAVTVSFIGYRYDGKVVSTNITTDGVIDGTGPVVDFQTFAFDDRFTGLERVEIPTYGWSLDNLVVGIPEPSSAVLLLLTGALLLWRRRSRTRPPHPFARHRALPHRPVRHI